MHIQTVGRTSLQALTAKALLKTLIWLFGEPSSDDISNISGGMIDGALRYDKTPSNMYIKIPGEEQHNENNNENEELTTADRINNFIKGALLGAYVGTAVDMVLGMTFSLMKAPSVGIPMFFVGNAFVLIIRELSKLFQMDLNAPSFDPSKKPQVHLPVNN